MAKVRNSPLILGLHLGHADVTDFNAHDWGPHDTAAALVDGTGQVLAAVEEERLNRIKHSNFFPVSAIQYCLESQQLELDEIDHIAIPFTRETLNEIAFGRFLTDSRVTTRSAEERLASDFERLFGADVAGKFRFTEHHEAHAWSAFGCAPFDRALIFVTDGEGDPNRSGLIAIGDGSGLEVLKRFSGAQSLGALYQNMVKIVGYHRFDEYKVMGLAPYGDPAKYEAVFARGYGLLKNGDYVLASGSRWIQIFDDAGFLPQIRRKGEPFTQFHKDFSAGLQQMIERLALHVLRHYRRKTRIPQLCVAGGVAHNCTLNGEIYRSGLFDEVFFQPVAHDAGLAIGAAFEVLHRIDARAPRVPLTHLYLGPSIGTSDAIGRELSAWGELVTIEELTNPSERAAQLIAGGAVIGWVQGRSELGPRALGNRSILADPRPASNKEIINQMIKKREGYRPFAPSVTEEAVETYFDVTKDRLGLPFMILTVNVKERFRSELGAITHVDGTARVQTVSRLTNPSYWALLERFGQLTGFPIVLNTSMNNNAEPIVDSVEDAVVCYLTTGLHHLVVGNYLVTKKPLASHDRVYDNLYPRIPLYRFLARRQRRGGTSAYCVGSNAHRWLAPAEREVSEQLFRVLERANGETSLGELVKGFGIGASARADLVRELLVLWEERCVVLSARRKPVTS